MWESICRTINTTYGRDYQSHKYKYDFFKNIIPFFATTPSVDYLEIGAFEGVSLLTVASLLRSQNKLGDIVAVDPYFPDGYFESPPGRQTLWKRSTPTTMANAERLFKAAQIRVDIVREVSAVALSQLLHAGRQFDMIFVDGNHETLNPMIDTSLAILLLKQGGLLCLDDINWVDVKPVAAICSAHMTLEFQTDTQIAFSRPLYTRSSGAAEPQSSGQTHI